MSDNVWFVEETCPDDLSLVAANRLFKSLFEVSRTKPVNFIDNPGALC
jgi:hypothetical protein